MCSSDLKGGTAALPGGFDTVKSRSEIVRPRSIRDRRLSWPEPRLENVLRFLRQLDPESLVHVRPIKKERTLIQIIEFHILHPGIAHLPLQLPCDILRHFNTAIPSMHVNMNIAEVPAVIRTRLIQNLLRLLMVQNPSVDPRNK